MRIFQKLKNQWDLFLFFFCLFFLTAVIAFGVGFYVAAQHKFPYFQIKTAAISVIGNYGLKLAPLIFTEKHKKYPFLWAGTKETRTGVVFHNPSGTCQGYTLIANNDTSAKLIDMQGKTLHEWHKSFSEVWPRPQHVKPLVNPALPELIYWQKAFLFPNGDLLAIYAGPFVPYGSGLVKINARSEIIWKADINAHHDLTIADDGRIFVLTHKYNYDARRPRIDDYVTVLSPGGEILKEVSIYEAIKTSPYYYLIPDNPYGDYLHTNNVDLLGRDKAAGFPFLRAGDVLLSHREAIGITVIDADTFKVKWALTGVASSVHDADFLENGRIAFFENKAYQQGSQILEWDCLLNKPHWQFTPADYFYGFSQHFSADDVFSSTIGGRQQKLPNGNYLVVETSGGSIFEVTPGKKVVWKYVSTDFDGESVGMLYSAERYSGDYLTFLHLSQEK